MDPLKLSTQEVLIYAALINAGIGFVLGLAPLILGFVKKNIKLGVLGMLAAIAGGAVLGILLSIPAAAVFSWLIVRGAKPSSEDVVETPPNPDSPDHS